MKENLPMEQCGMLKNSIFALFSCFFLLFFFLSLCFLDNAYWMLFPVLAAFVVDRFVIFFMSKGSGDLKMVKDTLSTSVYGLNAVRVSPCTVKGSKGWLCLYLSTPRRLLSPFKAIKSQVHDIWISWSLTSLILFIIWLWFILWTHPEEEYVCLIVSSFVG